MEIKLFCHYVFIIIVNYTSPSYHDLPIVQDHIYGFVNYDKVILTLPAGWEVKYGDICPRSFSSRYTRTWLQMCLNENVCNA